MAINKRTAQGALTRLSGYVAGIRDFDPATVQNSVLLTGEAQVALGSDVLAALRIEELVTGQGAETRLNLSGLRLAAGVSEQGVEAGEGSGRGGF